MQSAAFIALLEKLRQGQDLPQIIMTDNGPEFTSEQFITWCQKNGVLRYYIEKGRPTQNAYIESFNSRFRDECLNHFIFKNLFQDQRNMSDGDRTTTTNVHTVLLITKRLWNMN